MTRTTSSSCTLSMWASMCCWLALLCFTGRAQSSSSSSMIQKGIRYVCLFFPPLFFFVFGAWFLRCSEYRVLRLLPSFRLSCCPSMPLADAHMHALHNSHDTFEHCIAQHEASNEHGVPHRANFASSTSLLGDISFPGSFSCYLAYRCCDAVLHHAAMCHILSCFFITWVQDILLAKQNLTN